LSGELNGGTGMFARNAYAIASSDEATSPIR
jgi:hypothetical protein